MLASRSPAIPPAVRQCTQTPYALCRNTLTSNNTRKFAGKAGDSNQKSGAAITVVRGNPFGGVPCEDGEVCRRGCSIFRASRDASTAKALKRANVVQAAERLRLGPVTGVYAGGVTVRWSPLSGLNCWTGPGHSVRPVLTCEITGVVIRWFCFGLCAMVPRMCPRQERRSACRHAEDDTPNRHRVQSAESLCTAHLPGLGGASYSVPGIPSRIDAGSGLCARVAMLSRQWFFISNVAIRESGGVCRVSVSAAGAADFRSCQEIRSIHERMASRSLSTHQALPANK